MKIDTTTTDTAAINYLTELLDGEPPFTVCREDEDGFSEDPRRGWWTVTASAPTWSGSGPRFSEATGPDLLPVLGEAARGALAIHAHRLGLVG